MITGYLNNKQVANPIRIIETMKLSYEDRTRLYGALRSELNSLSVQEIRNTVARAGFDVSQITAKAEARSGLGSRAEVMPAVDRLFGEMAEEHQDTSLRLLAGRFVPVGELDQREPQFLPASASSEIARAMSRLMEEDYSGAITSACGAVDLVTQELYEENNLGDPGKVSFQAKVNTVFQHLNVFEKMTDDFERLGMKSDDVENLVEEMQKASNHAAQTLQILRWAMGDTHGTKPALRQTAYDAIKWSSALCGILRRDEEEQLSSF